MLSYGVHNLKGYVLGLLTQLRQVFSSRRRCRHWTEHNVSIFEMADCFDILVDV